MPHRRAAGKASGSETRRARPLAGWPYRANLALATGMGDGCSNARRDRMGRNARILFPSDLDHPPVDLVVALPSNTIGGTRSGMRLAEEFQIRLHDPSQFSVRARYRDRLAAGA